VTAIRSERDRRLGIEWNVELTELLVAVEIAAGAADRHFFFGVGELQAVDLFRAFQHVLAELRRGGAGAALGAHGGGNGHRRGDGSRNGFEETAAADSCYRFPHGLLDAYVRLDRHPFATAVLPDFF